MTTSNFIKKWKKISKKEASNVIGIIGLLYLNWNAAYLEVLNDTEIGKKILENM